MPPGRKPFKITTKHRKLVHWLMRTGTIKEAAKVAGFQYTHACEVLKKPELTQLLTVYQERAGLTDDLLTRTHVELLTKGEGPVRLGALRLGYQLKKKIGSDDAPPPAILPAVVILRPNVQDETKITDISAGESSIQIDRPAGPSLLASNKS